MDKNQIIGFLLIGVVLIGYVMLTKPSEKEIQQQQRIKDSLALVEQIKIQDSINKNNAIAISDTSNNVAQDIVTPQDVVTPQDGDNNTTDSLSANLLVDTFGPFANAAKGEQEFYYLQNDKLTIKISNKGGRVYSATLSDYTTHANTPLVIFDGDSNRFNINFFIQDKLIKTEDLYFEAQDYDTKIRADKSEQKLVLRAKISDDEYLEYVYTIKPEEYLIDFDINFVNLDKIIPINTTYLELYWDEYVKHLERGEKWETQNTMFFYKLYQSSVENLKNRKDSDEEEISSKIRWISYKQQFFNATLIAKEYFDFAKISAEKLENDTTNLFLMKSKITIPFHHNKEEKINLAFYFGPNQYSILNKITINDEKLKMGKLVPLGGKFLAPINKYAIIPMFNFLGRFIHNYGIIILVLTFIIKLVLFPFTYKSYASGAKMRIIKPELDKALAKYPEDKKMERQQATMSLYKKAGVNPMGGCLPMLFQFPILIALYRFFPASIELRQKSFLWVKDLSTYDAIATWTGNIPIVNWIFGNHISLFTLLMAVTMVFSTKMNNQNMDSSNPQAKSMKYMMYLMPIMMIVWFNGYSAGLSYYYFLSSLIGIIQILVIRGMINEEKVLTKMRMNMKKPTVQKKSKFQQRLEEAQKQQAQIKKNRKK